MDQCPGCKEPLRWWQRKGPPTNDSWHRKCWLSWNAGYETAYTYCEKINRINHLPSITEMYRESEQKATKKVKGDPPEPPEPDRFGGEK